MASEEIKCSNCHFIFTISYDNEYGSEVEEECPNCGQKYKGEWVFEIYPENQTL